MIIWSYHLTMPNASLSIFPVTEVRNLRFQCSEPALHTHPFHQVFVLTRGGGRQIMHGETVEFQAPWALVVPRGQAHLYYPTADAEGWSLGFTEEFLPAGTTLLVTNAFPPGGVALASPGVADRLCAIVKILHEGSSDASTFCPTAQFHLVAAFLQLLHQACQRQRPAEASLSQADHLLFQRFTRLMDEAYRSHWEMTRFAHELRCSQRRLGGICQRILGKSPHAALEERRMIEARRRLAHGTDSIQAIALDLGYEDPSYFAKAFRRVVGQTPTDYRNSRAGMVAGQ
ncbi:4-hydroxyphenylacetate catabolism regulatory protein HpaA [Mesoterricola sediminis]|uniref:4-hydroxyphenylacetate catabolism regulatory protein HpaA n=2 Tax=Mesoterricola sediminis TaxID=2927980 RepID=A0AA48H3X4_9BACT|nr:4-hydroxyphenylacetate catabolism regulatory protein HpaA [Mesoterricola sediminis]